MFPYVEEDADVRSDWAGFQGLLSEVIDGITSDGILLFYQGEYNMSVILEEINQSVS